MHPQTITSSQQSEAVSFNRLHSTPPTVPIAERGQPVAGKCPEPHRLAPLQRTQSGYIQPVSLPPLSQAPYGTHHHQQSASQQPHPQNYHQQVYTNSGLDMLAEASHHTPGPAAMVSYQTQPATYYPEYPATTVAALNDGFDSNLQTLFDGAGAQWSTPDAPGVMYNSYETPSFLL